MNKTEEKASTKIIRMIKHYIAEHDTLTWEILENKLDDMGVRIYGSVTLSGDK